jgi:hypothetical protein
MSQTPASTRQQSAFTIFNNEFGSEELLQHKRNPRDPETPKRSLPPAIEASSAPNAAFAIRDTFETIRYNAEVAMQGRATNNVACLRHRQVGGFG